MPASSWFRSSKTWTLAFVVAPAPSATKWQTDRYPEFTVAVFMKSGWDQCLTREMAIITRIGGNDAKRWPSTLSSAAQFTLTRQVSNNAPWSSSLTP